jgi:hypothetical protein
MTFSCPEFGSTPSGSMAAICFVSHPSFQTGHCKIGPSASVVRMTDRATFMIGEFNQSAVYPAGAVSICR